MFFTNHIICGRGPSGYDRTRNAEIGNKNFDLTYLEEAYTTEHWLVRIYRVKKPHEFNRPALKKSQRIIQSPGFVSRKVAYIFFCSFKRNIESHLKSFNSQTIKRKKGYIKNRPVVVKGKRVNKK